MIIKKILICFVCMYYLALSGGIGVRCSGGFGNNMFQYATSYAVTKQKGANLFLFDHKFANWFGLRHEIRPL